MRDKFREMECKSRVSYLIIFSYRKVSRRRMRKWKKENSQLNDRRNCPELNKGHISSINLTGSIKCRLTVAMWEKQTSLIKSF